MKIMKCMHGSFQSCNDCRMPDGGHHTLKMHGLMKSAVLVLAVVAGFLLFKPVMAAELPKEDKALLESKGIPLYPNAVFFGSARSSVQAGFKFMTSDPIDKVRKWYSEKMTGWSYLEYMGVHYIYKGKPGLKWSDLFGLTNVAISRDANAHKWYDEISPEMTTKIQVTILLSK